jgi:signal transduction histidine kinase
VVVDEAAAAATEKADWGINHLARAAVADGGLGIDPAGLERLFEPSAQTDVATTRLYGGTGFGLAITRELVELMGGTITAQSEPG